MGFEAHPDMCSAHWEDELRAEAVKWVKDDYSLVVSKETHQMLERWKRRFNLTERDIDGSEQ